MHFAACPLLLQFVFTIRTISMSHLFATDSDSVRFDLGLKNKKASVFKQVIYLDT